MSRAKKVERQPSPKPKPPGRKNLLDELDAVPNPKESKPAWEFKETDEDATIWSEGDAVCTIAEAIAKAGIDLRLWDIVEQQVTSWPTAMKLRRSHAGGKGYDEEPHKEWNFRVFVKLRRKAPKGIQFGIQELLADLRAGKIKHYSSRKITPRKLSDPHMLEVSLYDAHFGKLCWAAQTGDNYDLRIAQHDYVNAIDDLIEKVRGYEIERILFPIGNDFFQANNWIGTTARGTQVDCVDDRFQKVFKVGCLALTHAIERCREIAPTECVWIPGNHDPATSWYLCEWLSALFEGRKDDRVTVDTSPKSRKYVEYGMTLLGLGHGNSPSKLRDYIGLMPVEAKEAWARTHFHFFHVGHFHKKKSLVYNGGDTFNGTRVDVIPSISGTDQWHYEQGFVGNVRTAEAYLFSRGEGYRGHFSVTTRSQLADWEEEKKSSRKKES